MEDLTAKIQELLSDKESMQQINELAQMFTSAQEDQADGQKASSDGTEPENTLPFDMDKLMMISRIMGSADGGNGTALLLALKPFLKEERRERVDKAIKLLKLIAVGEMMKESGMLNDFLK